MESGAAQNGDGGATDATRPFRVGAWEVRPGTNEIVQGDAVVRLEPKAMQLLVLLAGRPGLTLSRTAMVEALWSGRTVTDDAINRQLAKLREALGDDPRTPVYIRTIPRTGVQLIAPVEQAGAAPAQADGRPARRARPAVAGAILAAVAGAAALTWLTVSGGVRLGPETRLTSEVGAETAPALSPDGRRLAYVANDRRLLVRGLDDPRAQALSATGTTAAAPAWSPSGGRVAYVQTSPGCAVMVGSPSALTIRKAWDCSGWRVGRLAWRDDRRLVLSASRDEAPSQLLMLDLGSGGVRVLTHPPASSLGDMNPLWAADRGRLYFVRTRAGGLADGDVFALDPARGTVSQVTHVGGWFNELTAGGRDGLTVVATRGEGLFSIWRIDLGSGRWRPLTGAGDYIGMSASADGRTLVFGKASGSISLVAADASGQAAPRVMTTSTAIDWRPAACGDQIAFLSSRSGAIQLWTMARGGGTPAQLTRLKGSLVEFACSRDGGLFALGINRDGRYGLMLFNRRTGATDALASADYGLHAPAFSAAADAVYFVRADRTLVRHDLASSTESVVARDVVRALAAPDGRTLYFARPDRQSLWRLDLASMAQTRLAVLPGRFAPMDFVLGDGALWVLGRPGSDHAAPLYRVGLGDGRVDARRRLAAPFGDNFGLAADGATLVYPRLDRLEVDLYRADVERAGRR